MTGKIKRILEKEPNLIRITEADKIVFVGDTHGDLETSKYVVKEYLNSQNKIVFLGDYVDRGPNSKENLDFLLGRKLQYPNNLYLLQGNHEGHHVFPFSPADFWESLSKEEYDNYSEIVSLLPLVVEVKGLLALHGGLPDIKRLKEVNSIKEGDSDWTKICWGDFSEEEGKDSILGQFCMRPQLNKEYFSQVMKNLNKKVLVRSHQPNISPFMFSDSCVTIFTSIAYSSERTIAVMNFSQEINTGRDLKMINLSS